MEIHFAILVSVKLKKHDFIMHRYRVVKRRNLQVVRCCDFEHRRARMAQFFFKTSSHHIYLLIQMKKLRSKTKTFPES